MPEKEGFDKGYEDNFDIDLESNANMVFSYDEIFEAVTRYKKLKESYKVGNANKWRPLEESKSPITINQSSPQGSVAMSATLRKKGSVATETEVEKIEPEIKNGKRNVI